MLTPMLMGGCDIWVGPDYREPSYIPPPAPVSATCDYVVSGSTWHGYATLYHTEDRWWCEDYVTLSGGTEIVDEGCDGRVDALAWDYWDPGCTRHWNGYDEMCGSWELWEAEDILADVKWDLGYDRCY